MVGIAPAHRPVATREDAPAVTSGQGPALCPVGVAHLVPQVEGHSPLVDGQQAPRGVAQQVPDAGRLESLAVGGAHGVGLEIADHEGHVDHRTAGGSHVSGQALAAQLGQGPGQQRGPGRHRQVGRLALVGLRPTPLAVGHRLDGLADGHGHLPHQLTAQDGDVSDLPEAHPVADLVAVGIEGAVLVPQANELVDRATPQLEGQLPGQA